MAGGGMPGDQTRTEGEQSQWHLETTSLEEHGTVFQGQRFLVSYEFTAQEDRGHVNYELTTNETQNGALLWGHDQRERIETTTHKSGSGAAATDMGSYSLDRTTTATSGVVSNGQWNYQYQDQVTVDPTEVGDTPLVDTLRHQVVCPPIPGPGAMRV